VINYFPNQIIMNELINEDIHPIFGKKLQILPVHRFPTRIQVNHFQKVPFIKKSDRFSTQMSCLKKPTKGYFKND
jgi:hypothetical protein